MARKRDWLLNGCIWPLHKRHYPIDEAAAAGYLLQQTKEALYRADGCRAIMSGRQWRREEGGHSVGHGRSGDVFQGNGLLNERQKLGGAAGGEGDVADGTSFYLEGDHQPGVLQKIERGAVSAGRS